MKLGRNAPCHCGSGRKYKQCHLEQDAAARVAALNDQADVAHTLAEREDYLPPDPAEADPRERRKKGKTTLRTPFWIILGLVAAAVLVVTLLNRPADDGGERVWSPEHGHYHEVEASGTPVEPGALEEPPAGRVWSEEHGHWHDP